MTLICLEHSWWKSGAAPYCESSLRVWSCRKGRCIVWWVFCFHLLWLFFPLFYCMKH